GPLLRERPARRVPARVGSLGSLAGSPHPDPDGRNAAHPGLAAVPQEPRLGSLGAGLQPRAPPLLAPRSHHESIAGWPIPASSRIKLFICNDLIPPPRRLR